MCVAADSQPEPSAPEQERCFVCEGAAVSHCEECFAEETGKLYLCRKTECFKKTHGTARMAEKHQKSLRAWGAAAPWTVKCCEAHDGNVLALWCRTCACLLCPLCAQFGGAHEGHTVAQVGKVWRERQEQVQATVGPLGDVLATCSERVRQLAEEQEALASGGGAVAALRRALDETGTLLAVKVATLRSELDTTAEEWSAEVAAEHEQVARYTQNMQTLADRMRAACGEDNAGEAQRLLLTLEELCAQRDALGSVPPSSAGQLEVRAEPLRQAAADLRIAATTAVAATGAARHPRAAASPPAHGAPPHAGHACLGAVRDTDVYKALNDVGPAKTRRCIMIVFLLVILLLTGTNNNTLNGHGTQQKNDHAVVRHEKARATRESASPPGVPTASGNASSCRDNNDSSESVSASATPAQPPQTDTDTDSQQAPTAVPPSAEPTGGNETQSVDACDDDAFSVVDGAGDEDAEAAAADGGIGGVGGDEAEKKADAALPEGAAAADAAQATPADGEGTEESYLLRCCLLFALPVLLTRLFYPRVAATYNCIGNVYYRQQKYVAALVWYSKARATREEKAPNSLELAETYTNIGNVRFHQQQYDDALLWYNKACVIREDKVPHSLELGETYLGIGNVRYHQDQYDAALLYYNKARAIPEGMSLNSLELAEMYSNIGNVHYRQGQYDTALLWYKIACAIREDKAPKSRGLADTYTCLGRVYGKQEKHRESVACYLNAQACLRV